MAEVLRGDAGSLGLVTSVSGMLTKPGMALWSTEPGSGYQLGDATDQARADTATRPLDPDAVGDGRIVAHTVVHERGEPARLVALVETTDGRRTVAVDGDAAHAAEAVGQDLVEPAGRPHQARRPRLTVDRRPRPRLRARPRPDRMTATAETTGGTVPVDPGIQATLDAVGGPDAPDLSEMTVEEARATIAMLAGARR